MNIYYYESEPGLTDGLLLPLLKQYTSVNYVPLPEGPKTALDNWNGSEDFRYTTISKFSLTPDDRVLITTPKSSPLEKWCVKDCSHALWGWSDGTFSVIYTEPPVRLSTQFHECLHFLGVDDCYVIDDPAHPAKPSCTRDDCVMRYGVNSLKVCDSVLTQINNFQKQ